LRPWIYWHCYYIYSRSAIGITLVIDMTHWIHWIEAIYIDMILTLYIINTLANIVYWYIFINIFAIIEALAIGHWYWGCITLILITCHCLHYWYLHYYYFHYYILLHWDSWLAIGWAFIIFSMNGSSMDQRIWLVIITWIHLLLLTPHWH